MTYCHRLSLLLAISISCPAIASAQQPISIERIRSDVKYLASDQPC